MSPFGKVSQPVYFSKPGVRDKGKFSNLVISLRNGELELLDELGGYGDKNFIPYSPI